MQIARQIKAYEDVKFHEWRINIENILPEILKTNLLIKPKYKPSETNLILPANVNPDTGIFIYLNGF